MPDSARIDELAKLMFDAFFARALEIEPDPEMENGSGVWNEQTPEADRGRRVFRACVEDLLKHITPADLA